MSNLTPLATYAFYLDGDYQYPVSHSHACSLIDIDIPLSDAVGCSYERVMGFGDTSRTVLLTRMTDRVGDPGNEDAYIDDLPLDEEDDFDIYGGRYEADDFACMESLGWE